MPKEKPIEKVLFPNAYKVKSKNGVEVFTIVDAELDPIECIMLDDEAITIDTEKLQYIALTKENLEFMLKVLG